MRKWWRVDVYMRAALHLTGYTTSYHLEAADKFAARDAGLEAARLAAVAAGETVATLKCTLVDEEEPAKHQIRALLAAWLERDKR